MLKFSYFLLFSAYFLTQCFYVQSMPDAKLITTKTFMFWPNATVPFFIMPQHFDYEQKMAIMNSLSTFAFQTCVKFYPVMSMPKENQHILTFANPNGVRRCTILPGEHSNFLPHRVIAGYDCLKSPEIDMIIMRALGLPFEHNRMSRDVYIEVLLENVEPHAVPLFTRESVLPPSMRALPYDINSVMHFGERDYSKNGHRTIIFKNHNLRQKRVGLTANDLRKIELVYGPECRIRDRQEKFELCQAYPGLVRRKRDIEPTDGLVRGKRDIGITDPPANKSLRVNRNITPPPLLVNLPEATPLSEKQVNNTTDTEIDGANHIAESLTSLGIANETDDIIEQVYKVSALALKNARDKYCNTTENKSEIVKPVENTEKKKVSNSSDILGILEVIADYAKSMVDHAIQNLTTFCESSKSIEEYQRQCRYTGPNSRCPKTYRSTKGGAVKFSTQHYPVYKQQTKHDGRPVKASYVKFRRNDDSVTTPLKVRRKREVTTPAAVESEKKVREVNLEDKVKIVDAAMNASEKAEKKLSVGKTKKENKMEDKKVNTEKDKIDEKIPRRYFKESRYKVKRKDDGSGDDWEESNVSMDKGGDTITNQNAEKDPGIDHEHKSKSKDGDEDEETESEQEKVINKEDLVKEALSEGLDSILGTNNDEKDIKEQTAIEDEEGDEGDEANDGEKGDIGEEDEKQKEKEQSEKEDSMDAEKSEEKAEEIKEEVEETTTETPKVEAVRPEAEVLSAHHQVKHEVHKTKKKAKKAKKQKTRVRKRKSQSDIPETVKLNKLNKEFYNERRWPDGIVRYVIKKIPGYDLEDLRNRLAEVNTILMRKTCVKLIEVDAKEARGYDDYLVLDNSPDYVTGRVGGKQIFGCVELFKGNQHVQHTAMMVMAMLGFYFEVSRHDRDKYIRVHNRHVRPDKLHHFEKIRDEATLDLPYDFQSATHPAWQFWRKIGKTGISTVATYKDQDPDGSIMRSLGQNSELLSEGDIIKINSVYGVQCFQSNRPSERMKKTKQKPKKSKKDES